MGARKLLLLRLDDEGASVLEEQQIKMGAGGVPTARYRALDMVPNPPESGSGMPLWQAGLLALTDDGYALLLTPSQLLVF